MAGILGAFGGLTGGLGAIGAARVELLLDASKYQAELEAAKADTETSAAEMEAATAKASAAASAAWIGGAGAAALFAKASVSAAIAQNEAQDKLANSIQNNTKVTFASLDAFNKQADSIAQLTGVQNDQITSAQAMGVQFGLTADQVTQLTPLVVDLAVKNGVNLTTAMSAVGKAVNGNSGALARLKLNVDKTAFASDHFGATLDALNKGVKGFAETVADQQPWKKLLESLHEVEQNVGQELLPQLQAVTGAMADISDHHLPAASDAWHVFGDTMKLTDPILGDVIGQFNQTSGASNEFQQAINELDTDAKNGNVTLSDMIDRVHALGEQYGLSADVQQKMIDALTAEIPAAQKVSQATTDLANSHKKAAQAARDQKQAEQELAGGALGLISSLEQLRSDQEKYNKLQEKGRLDTQAGRATTEAVLNDQVSLNQAFQQYIQNAKKAGETSLTFQQVLAGVARQSGISKQALIDMLDSVSTHGKDGISTLDQLQNRLNRLKTTKITVPIEVQIAGVADSASFATEVRAIVTRELARRNP